MTIGDSDYHFMLNSLNIQLRLVRDRIEQMQLVEKAIQDTAQVIQEQHTIDWSQMLNLIHLTGMEKKSQKPVSECHQYFLQDQPPQSVLSEQTGLVPMDLPAMSYQTGTSYPGTWLR